MSKGTLGKACEEINKPIIFLLFASILLLMLLIFLPALGVNIPPAVILPLLIIVGVTSLLASLVLAAHCLRHLDLFNKNEALGLPTGSIRAIIALSLILIFAIMTIFMFTYLNDPQITETITITNTTKIGDPMTGNITTTINTTTIAGPGETMKEYSQQTLTTIGTLVVAVAAFYFGTRSVQVAQGSEETADLFIDPSGEIQLPAGKEEIIVVKGTPENEAITWTVEGDKPNSVIKVTTNRFKFKPTVAKGATVKLTFKMPKYDDVKDKVLTVKIT